MTSQLEISKAVSPILEASEEEDPSTEVKTVTSSVLQLLTQVPESKVLEVTSMQVAS